MAAWGFIKSSVQVITVYIVIQKKRYIKIQNTKKTVSFLCVLQVNGVNIEGMRHAEVVAFIKKGGDETWLLVVDPDTDEHFKRRGVVPTINHVRGRTILTGGDVSRRKFNSEEGWSHVISQIDGGCFAAKWGCYHIQLALLFIYIYLYIGTNYWNTRNKVEYLHFLLLSTYRNIVLFTPLKLTLVTLLI